MFLSLCNLLSLHGTNPLAECQRSRGRFISQTIRSQVFQEHAPEDNCYSQQFASVSQSPKPHLVTVTYKVVHQAHKSRLSVTSPRDSYQRVLTPLAGSRSDHVY